MGRPTIGITSPLEWIDEEDLERLEVGRHATLLRSLGAETVILPRGKATAEALAGLNLHGLLFSGGGDVSASLYGGREALARDRIDPIRDAGEVALLRKGFAERIPMLCVCRGMQLANVAFGGTLIEDLPSELYPNYKISHHQMRELDVPATVATHEVSILRGSMLGSIVRREMLAVNSLHHQAVRSVAVPLTAAAHAADGVIEALELRAPEAFFLGVQWHPESLPAANSSQQIYSAFIEASAA